MRRLYIYTLACAIPIALAGCSGSPGGPRTAQNYIEPPPGQMAPMMPVAGPIAPAPNLGVVMPRVGSYPAAAPKRVKCPPGTRWVRAHRAPGAAGVSRQVPGRCMR